MIYEEEKIRSIKANIDEYSKRTLALSSFSAKDEAEFHKYIQQICQRLLGDSIDLSQEPIIFALSDKKQENAAFAHKEGAYQIIFITESLLNLCENEDQLAFILAHELGHFEENKRQGKHRNSKAEETAADLRAIQKMAQAGYNLEEAHKIAVKIFDSYYINIESLKDDHVNDKTRVNAIDAMIIATKQRIIESTNASFIETTSPIDEHIKDMVASRSKISLLSERLRTDIAVALDTKTASQIWINAFHEALCDTNGTLRITDDDTYALHWSIYDICRKDKNQADVFLASILVHFDQIKNDPNYNQIKELMSEVLHKVYSYDASIVSLNADNEDSQTAAILRHYLKGFREASGDNFDKMMQNFEHIRPLVAKVWGDGYKGVFVKNFNLLELDFNETDIGKHFSPEIINYIKRNLNAKDQFETISGLTFNIAGDNLIIKNEKLSVCTIVNRDGNVCASLPLEKLDNLYNSLIADTITNSYHDILDIKNNKSLSDAEKFNKLKSVFNILEPQPTINNINNILKIRNSKDKIDISLSGVVELLDDDVKAFFAERSARPYNIEQSPYMSFIVDNMADYIRKAQPEEFSNILNYLTFDIRCNEEKLWTSFFENKEFFSILQQQFSQINLTPSSEDDWSIINTLFNPNFDQNISTISNMLIRLHDISDKKLLEHISSGKDLNSFEAPFTKQIGELCGFSNGKFSKQELEDSINQTRNINHFQPSPLQEAYALYYSYDALKDDAQIDLSKTGGTNCAGTKIGSTISHINAYLEEPEEYSIDEAEAELLKKQKDTYKNAYDVIKQKLVNQINDEKNWSTYNGNSIFDNIRFLNDSGFHTIIKREDFLEACLKLYPNDKDRINCIQSLQNIVNYSDSSVKNDAMKEKIFPVISSIFNDGSSDVHNMIQTFHHLSKYDLFKSDNIDYYNILTGTDGKSGLLEQISHEPASIQENCYEILLNKEARIPDPEIRAEIIKRYAQAWHKNHAYYNDITATPEQREEVIKSIQRIKTSNIAPTDKIELLKELSEITMSQKELSLIMKPTEIDIQASDPKAIISAYGIDAVAYLINNNPELNEQMQDFLLGYGSSEEAHKLNHALKYALCKEADKKYNYNLCEKFEKGEDISEDLPYSLRKYYFAFNAEKLKSFKNEFDAASLEAKALIVNELITNGKNNWQSSFEIVSKKLFEGAGDLAKMGSDFLYSYIDARPDSEKTFYLAAMMAAATNKSKSSANHFIESPYTPEQRSLAKGLRMFLENSGPAGTKLAQAMASYSDVPDFIRFEMQFAKSQANPPARWEIFSDNDGMSSEILKQGPLGKRLGSASFFVTYEIGDKIVKILRRGAKTKADNEFKIYREMLTTLSSKYDNISSFKRLVDNAADNVIIETDLDIGYKQLLDAKKLYPEKVTTDKIEFNLDVKNWSERGKDWAILEKAQGIDFKDLTEPYKTSVAKTIFSTELANMLSGKRFDSDRHGGQYKIDPKTNTIGIFDTGSISMVEPTQKEQEVLGVVLARTAIGITKNPNIAGVFSQEIDKAISEFYKTEISQNRSIPPYLSEFQRGLLALNDFYAGLQPKDLIECFTQSMNNGHHKINENIVKGFKSEIAKHLESKNQTIEKIIKPESMDKLAPEARANRRVGMILFNGLFNAAANGEELKLDPQVKDKIYAKLNSDDSSMQIFKGVIRGAWSKINYENYSTEDRKELGNILYQVCAQDMANKKLKKDISIQETFEQIEKKHPNRGQYCKNIGTIFKIIAQTSNNSSEDIKRAALFIAFLDPHVTKGYKKAALEDKSVSFGKRLLNSISPLSFIPHKAKKLLVKNIGKKRLINYLNTQLYGNTLGKTASKQRA